MSVRIVRHLAEPWNELILPQVAQIALPALTEKIDAVAQKHLPPLKEQGTTQPQNVDDSKQWGELDSIYAEFGV